MAGMAPKTDSEAIMLMWNGLFGNGIEGAIPRMEKALVRLEERLNENEVAIQEEEERLTDYIASRIKTCPLTERKEKKWQGTARLIAIIGGVNTIIIGITTLIAHLAGLF